MKKKSKTKSIKRVPVEDQKDVLFCFCVKFVGKFILYSLDAKKSDCISIQNGIMKVSDVLLCGDEVVLTGRIGSLPLTTIRIDRSKVWSVLPSKNQILSKSDIGYKTITISEFKKKDGD